MKVGGGVMKRARTSAYRTARGRRIARVKRGILSRNSRNVHSFRRMCTSSVVDVAGTEYDFAGEFKFGDITGAAEFSSLYDRYMLTTVVMKIRIVNNPNAANYHNTQIAYNTNNGSNATNWFPRLFSCPDYDDAVTETLTQLRERARTKMVVLRPNMYAKFVIKPAVAVQTYRTALTDGYAPKWGQWLDMNQTDVPHYGMKFAMDMSGSDPADTLPFKLEIEKIYYFKCKDVR